MIIPPHPLEAHLMASGMKPDTKEGWLANGFWYGVSSH